MIATAARWSSRELLVKCVRLLDTTSVIGPLLLDIRHLEEIAATEPPFRGRYRPPRHPIRRALTSGGMGRSTHRALRMNG